LEEVFELGDVDEGSSEEKELSSLTELQLIKLPEEGARQSCQPLKSC